MDVLKEYGISHYVEAVHNNWLDCGELRDYHRSDKELDRQFNRCRRSCNSLLNGRLYYFPEPAMAVIWV